MVENPVKVENNINTLYFYGSLFMYFLAFS